MVGHSRGNGDVGPAPSRPASVDTPCAGPIGAGSGARIRQMQAGSTSPTTEFPSGPIHRKTTLDNGLRVITGEMPHTRSVSISIFVGVGSRHEPEGQAGASHFLEHLLFKGTESRPEPEMISGAVEGVGGVLNAETEQEFTVYWCKVPQPYLFPSLDLLIDLVRNPLLPSEEVERERSVVLDELAMIHDHPDYKVQSQLEGMLWPDHPLGRDIAGTGETVSALSRETLFGHMERYYTPSNVVVSVAGAVEHDPVVAQVERTSAGWRAGPAAEYATYDAIPRQPAVSMEYRRTEQAHLSIGLPGVSMFHPDRYALDMLSVALGEGMSSRLFLEVRERRGLAYDVHSSVTHFRDCGSFQISAGAEPRRIYETVDTILAELASIRDGIPESEFDKVRRLASGRLMLGMEDTRAVSSWFGLQEMLMGRIVGIDGVMERLGALTCDDLDRTAASLFVSDGLSMAVVGPCRGRRRLETSLKL